MTIRRFHCEYKFQRENNHIKATSGFICNGKLIEYCWSEFGECMDTMTDDELEQLPAALWPSMLKLVDEKIIGSAYAAIFWIQNIDLGLFPALIGMVLNNTNPESFARTNHIRNTLTPDDMLCI